jgi:antitoxin ParD1/3/4
MGGDKGQDVTYVETPPPLRMAMNVKTTITLQEDYLRYAEKMVEEGVFPSISSVVEAGLARIMHGDILAGPLAGMADEIRRRMELPRDQ